MRFKSLLNKFPPPEYLDVPFSGIVFSDTKLKFLELNRRTKKPTVFGEIDIEPGVLQSGVIKNESSLINALNKIKPSLKSNFVRYVVADEVSYTFTTNVPVFEGKDAGESVEFILEENVPLPLADTSFDFAVVKVRENKEGESGNFSAKVVVTAVSTSVVESYNKVLRDVGLLPMLCINESQSIARAVVSEDKEGSSAIICIHANSVGFYITSGRLVEFSSTLAISPDDTNSFALLVTEEFNKVFDYWRSKNPEEWDVASKQVFKCFVCGKSNIAKRVESAMKKNQEVSSSLANVWTNAFSLEKYIPDISFEDSLRFGSAVGLFV